MTRSTYLLVREDADRSYSALMSDAEPTRLLSSIALPMGASGKAAEQLLQSTAGLGEGAAISTTLRGTPGSLGRAAIRCAEALGVAVRLIDIAHDAGRVAWASPSQPGALITIAEAALIPTDAAERRRRCDAVLRATGERDRAAVADQLGDIADRPLSGRDEASDQIRAAACVDAIRSLAERLVDQDPTSGVSVIIATGQLAAYLSSGAVPLVAVSPIAPLGRSTVLLDRAGVVAALGTDQLTESMGADLARATAEQLLVPAGDLLVVADHAGGPLTVRVGAEEQALLSDGALEFELLAGEAASIEVESEGHLLAAKLHGGLAGICVVRGTPLVEVPNMPVSPRRAKVLPIEAPIELLPRSASATGGLGGRLLLGDEVEGRLHFSPTEPDSRGWAAAHAAGILAVVSVSPETVLRARAVGIRGLVVGSLSDGEREALSASIDRRVAAGVAPEPFGLLILGGRRESDQWTTELGRALHALHDCDVRFERHPAGLITSAARATAVPIGVNTMVIGGPLAGSYGTWRGLADAQASDPRGAIEINGDLVALPLGDLQRLTA